MSQNNYDTKAMFRPPVDRTMKVLDRTFFKKKISLSAARVFENKQLSALRKTLSNEILQVDRVSPITALPADNSSQGGEAKGFLLRPEIRLDEPSTWTDKLNKLLEEKTIDLSLILADDIVQAVLTTDESGEIPSGYSVVGHVAHLNLREHFWPHKHLIAQVILDKSPAIRTVINKIDDVGAENEFRTFKYEILAGDPSLDVELMELGCSFRFNYGKVYWNSRLNTEHERLVNLFQPGEAVCDVMAGVGPFAIPGAKRHQFIWANDLNPDSYEAMVANGTRNKVTDFLKTFNMDGREFIRKSAQEILKDDKTVEIKAKIKHSRSQSKAEGAKPAAPVVASYVQPKTFQHYVMNLPATATHFLDAFIGLYAGQEGLFAADTGRRLLPLVHCYCFSFKEDSNERAEQAICDELSARLAHPMVLGENELAIYDVRDVAPKKRMFCASFRLPPEVAFRQAA